MCSGRHFLTNSRSGSSHGMCTYIDSPSRDCRHKNPPTSFADSITRYVKDSPAATEDESATQCQGPSDPIASGQLEDFGRDFSSRNSAISAGTQAIQLITLLVPRLQTMFRAAAFRHSLCLPQGLDTLRFKRTYLWDGSAVLPSPLSANSEVYPALHSRKSQSVVDFGDHNQFCWQDQILTRCSIGMFPQTSQIQDGADIEQSIPSCCKQTPSPINIWKPSAQSAIAESELKEGLRHTCGN
jgi:hypothetical protein